MRKYLLDLNNEGHSVSIVESLKEFYQRLKGIVISPSETMKDLGAKPNMLFPILLIIIVVIGTLLINTAQYKEYTKGELIKANVQDNVTMSSEKIDQAVNKNSNLRLLVIPLITLSIWMAGTVILYLFIRVFRGSGNFREYLTITGYAYIIIIFSGILQSVVVLISGEYLQNFNITSLGFILPKSLKGNFFYGMSGGIELFKIWNYYVVGIGVCYISKLSKVKVYSAIGIMFVWPILFGGLSEVLSTIVK